MVVDKVSCDLIMCFTRNDRYWYGSQLDAGYLAKIYICVTPERYMPKNARVDRYGSSRGMSIALPLNAVNPSRLCKLKTGNLILSVGSITMSHLVVDGSTG